MLASDWSIHSLIKVHPLNLYPEIRMKVNALLCAFSMVFVSPVFATLSKLNSDRPTIPSECSFPLLKLRLLDMIAFNEPEAFEIILHSECGRFLNTSHVDYIEVFDHLLLKSESANMVKFLKIMMKDSAYTPLMFTAWAAHRPLVGLPVLKVLKMHFKRPESAAIFPLKLEYPQASQESQFLADWLVSLQSSTLNWPFSPSPIKNNKSADFATLKSKSFHENCSEYNVPDAEINDFSTAAIDIPVVIPLAITETLSTAPILNFGHIYGWVSRNNNPIVRNSPDLFYLSSHFVKLQDIFLGFSSPNFKLNIYADSAKNSVRSFFDKPQSALTQKIRQSGPTKNFSACRLHGNNLQVVLKGNLMMVVLGQLSDGTYYFKYPTNPYQDLLIASEVMQTFSLPINPSDIVLILPRILFTDPEFSILPHDVLGTFHYTELSSFASTFVNFINFVHHRTKHFGLIAVGGFVHVRE